MLAKAVAKAEAGIDAAVAEMATTQPSSLVVGAEALALADPPVPLALVRLAPLVVLAEGPFQGSLPGMHA
jgi:hypothetical protein